MQMFGTIKHIVAGKNSLNETFSVFLVEIHKNVLSLLTIPPIEFCKTAATATTLSTKTTMDRAFWVVVAAPFFMR